MSSYHLKKPVIRDEKISRISSSMSKIITFVYMPSYEFPRVILLKSIVIKNIKKYNVKFQQKKNILIEF